MLRHRQRPLPGPRGSPGTAEKRGHRWPHATGGAQASNARWRRPRSPWGLVNRPADAEEVGDGKCPATPHPIAQEEVAWLPGPAWQGVHSQGERQQAMARKPYVLSERPPCPPGSSLRVAAGLIR
ncbi:hypothetical protein E2I00_019527, partial [Balaenoptera physalus]